MFLADLTTFLIKSNMGFRCTKGQAGFLVHDASTLAFLFYPETVRLTRGKVKAGNACVLGVGRGGASVTQSMAEIVGLFVVVASLCVGSRKEKYGRIVCARTRTRV